jgi:predicted dehydrogenase
MWQGQAPRRPYSPSRLGWRAFYAYGGGLITDWGVHLTDIAHMALGCDTKGPSITSASGQWVNMPRDDEQVPESFICNWQYDKFVMSFTNIQAPGEGLPSSGNWFYGRHGVILLNRSGYRITPSPSRGGMGRGGAAGADVGTILHTRNFLDCIKSRQKPNCDIEVGFYSSLPCLIALLAIQQGRSFTWDGKTAKPV